MTIRQLLENRKDLRRYLFIRDFFVTDAECSVDGGFPFYDNFDKNKLGKYYFYTHKKTGFHYHSDNGKIYFILGHAYNPFTMQYKEDEILKRVAGLANKKQWQEAVDELTGVFVIGFVENDSIAYMVDPSGMQSLCSDITIIYNNRNFLDLLFRVPLEDRISDKHHLDTKKYLNKDLYDMNIRVVNMKETDTRAFLLNCIFTANMISIF